MKTYVVCRLCQGKPCLPPASPPLPNYWISFNHPFEVTGIDYAAPLFIPDSSSKNMKKSYLLLLTCASTHCVHLELVIDYRLQSFLLAFKCFISWWGTSKLFISDNFSTFKSREVTDFLRHYDISWEFILQKSPWWGGFYEKLIGITKMSLKKVVGKARLSYDELVTVIYMWSRESINLHSLTYLTEENYQTLLSPYHLLYGRNINDRNEPLNNIETNQTSAIVRVKHLQTVLEHFKKRVCVEYLLSLHEKHSYVKNKTSSQRYLKEGDVVLIKENNSIPQLSWKKRVYNWKTNYWEWQKCQRCISSNNIWEIDKSSILNRPLQLLIPLELSSSENVETIEKDKNEPLQTIIEKHCDITPDENIENRGSKHLAAKNVNIMNKLMFEQWVTEVKFVSPAVHGGGVCKKD